MFCPRCGESVAENAKFCRKCGLELNMARKPASGRKRGYGVVGNYIFTGWLEPGWLLNSVVHTLCFDHHLHLYYLQILLLLYAALPVLRALVRGATEKELDWAIFLWAVLGIGWPLLKLWPPLAWLGGITPQYPLNMCWAALGYALLGHVMNSREEAFVRGLQRDYNGKVQTLNRLISDYPESQYMDDALYEQGRAFPLDADKFKDCNVRFFTDGYYPRVVRLSKDIPTFDSGDREYDSWHDLYLVQEQSGNIHAVYCTGGYRIATIQGYAKVHQLPNILKKYFF